MKAWLTAGASVALAAWAANCAAHSIGVSRGTYQLTERGVSAEMVFDPDELGPGAAPVAAGFAERIHVTAGAEPCECTLTHTREGADSTLRLRLDFDCPGGPASRSVRLDFWNSLAEGHRHVVTAAQGARATSALSFIHAAEFELLSSEPPPLEAAPLSAAPSWLGWLRYGIEHIWAGADHLLFIFALVLGMQSFRALCRVTLTFTLAHSLTLALAATGIVTPPAALVEPLIAASIAFVAFENATRRRSRTATVFAFGLIHGFGFAGALEEVGLTSWERPEALALFNLGVELGQLGLLCLCVPVVAWLGKRSWFHARALPCLNAAIGLVSLVWLSERVSTAVTGNAEREPAAFVSGLQPDGPLSSRFSTRRANMNATSVGAIPKIRNPSTRFSAAARQAPSRRALCSGSASPDAAATAKRRPDTATPTNNTPA